MSIAPSIRVCASPTLHTNCTLTQVWAGKCWDELRVFDDTARALALSPAQRFAAAAPRLAPPALAALRASMRRVANRSIPGTHPTTGAIAIYAALRLCEAVDLYGFGGGGCASVAGLQRGKYYHSHQGRNACATTPRAQHTCRPYSRVQPLCASLTRTNRLGAHVFLPCRGKACIFDLDLSHICTCACACVIGVLAYV